MRVTINDVGTAARVSVATVSNVLNTPEKVAPETRERVIGVIEELGYRPNRAARALQQQRTFSVGYRIPMQTDGFALDVFLHTMADRAIVAGLDIVLFAPRPGQSEVDAYRDMIRRGAVDGFVLSETTRDDARLDYLLDTGVPLVTFGRTDSSDRHPWVDVDGRRGMRNAVAHLVSSGHSSVGFIGWPEGSLSGDERFTGYLDGLADAGLSLNTDLVVRTNNGFEEGREAVAELLVRVPELTAVVAVQDFLGLGAMSGAKHLGRIIGEDFAVVGFDDIPSARLADPSMSSIRQPIEDVGTLVMELLAYQLESDTTDRRQSATLVPELIIRQSSGPDPRRS